MYQYFPALSWAATGMVVLIYFGSQHLAIGSRSGLYYIAASPLVGAALFALRQLLQQPRHRPANSAIDSLSEGDVAVVNDAAVEEPPKQQRADLARRWKLLAAAAIVVSAPLCNWLAEFQVQTDVQWYALAAVNLLVYSFGAMLWSYFDSLQYGLTVHIGYRVLVFVLPALGFPIYALKTRGVRGLTLILAAALFMMLSFALTKSILMITEYYSPSV